MRARTVTVRTKNGLHMRIAGRIIEKSGSCRSKVTFSKGQSTADGRSIIGLLMLAASQGSEVDIAVEGADEEEVLRELERMLSVEEAL